MKEHPSQKNLTNSIKRILIIFLIKISLQKKMEIYGRLELVIISRKFSKLI